MNSQFIHFHEGVQQHGTNDSLVSSSLLQLQRFDAGVKGTQILPRQISGGGCPLTDQMPPEGSPIVSLKQLVWLFRICLLSVSHALVVFVGEHSPVIHSNNVTMSRESLRLTQH